MSPLTDDIHFILDPSLSLRSARWADVEAVAQLTLDICTSDGDPTAAMTPDELRNHWQAPGFDFEKNTWVVTTSEGRIVGYEEFVNRHAHASLMGDGYVHPDFLGMGVCTTMLPREWRNDPLIPEPASSKNVPDLQLIDRQPLDSPSIPDVLLPIKQAEG